MTPELQQQVSQELAKDCPRARSHTLRAQILRTLGHFPSEKSGAMLAAGLHDQNHATCAIAAAKASVGTVDRLLVRSWRACSPTTLIWMSV